jgi:DNA-binding beta-propeller fold protein YncE
VDGTFAFIDIDGTVVVGVSDTGDEVWSRFGAYPGALGIALGEQGRVWIADTLRNRIVQLDSGGKELLTHGDRGAFPGLFNAPSGLALYDGDLFIADTLNHRVAVHDASSGEFRYQWGMHAVTPREGEGKIHYPEDVAVAPDGSFVVVLEPFERRYQRFGRMAGEIDPSGTLPKKLAVESHFGAELGIDGDLLVMHEPESGAAMVFDLRGDIPIHISTFARAGSGSSQLGRIASIAVDAVTQEVWFLDLTNQRIAAWRLDRDREARLRQDPFMGSFVRSISFASLARRIGGERFVPGYLVFADGLLNVVERNGERVALLSPRFSLEGVVDLDRERDGVVVQRVASHPAGGWVVLSKPGGMITRYGADGTRQTLGISEEQRSQLGNAFGLAVLENGTLVVSDRSRDELVFFGDSERRSISETGIWDGALWRPGEVHPFPKGRVVVVDQGNHRAEVFDPATGQWSLTFSLGMGHNTPMFLKETPK